MKIFVTNKQKDLRISLKSVKATVLALLSFLKLSIDEVSFQFVTEKKICELHAEFFEDPSPTDCITFPVDDPNTSGYRLLGEVFVCPKTAKIYASSHGIDVYEELTLYVIHGLLHLIGYDDLHPNLKKKMRAKEKACLQFLKKSHSLLKG